MELLRYLDGTSFEAPGHNAISRKSDSQDGFYVNRSRQVMP